MSAIDAADALILRVTDVDPTLQQDWKQYSVSLVVSNIFLWLATWTIVTLQQYLPLNPDGIANMEPTLAFNSVSSFTTNTNLQHYSGETGLSYLSQMGVATFLQFVTAGTGMAACIAVIRGIGGNRLRHVGNLYVDVTRATVRVLLPLAFVIGLILLWQGSPMCGYQTDRRADRRSIGPSAGSSQVASPLNTRAR